MSEVSSTVSVESIAESEIFQMLQSRDEIKQRKSPVKLRARGAFSSPCLQTRLTKVSNGLPSQGGASSPSLARLGKKAVQQLGRLSAGTSRKDQQPPPQKEVSIVLVKSAGGKPFGFSLCGGKGSKRGDVGLYIRSIQDGGLAAEDGRLQVGDEILGVNGQTLEGTTHKRAAGIIKVMHYTVIQEIFIVEQLLYSPKGEKIRHKKHFQHTWQVLECELNFRRVQKILFWEKFYCINTLTAKFSTLQYHSTDHMADTLTFTCFVCIYMCYLLSNAHRVCSTNLAYL